MTQAPTRPAGLRADAARNRASILQAARKLIGRHGAEAGMDEIAREAGVAVGTLYRHFPTKHDLVQAIVEELTQHIFALLDHALAGIDDGATAAGALSTLLAGTAEAIGNDRAVKAAITNLGLPEPAEVTERALQGLGRVVAAGHADGSLRADTGVEDLVLILTTIPGDEVPPAARKRWLELMLRALTA
jgi:AcrR family transcriptional regulator